MDSKQEHDYEEQEDDMPEFDENDQIIDLDDDDVPIDDDDLQNVDDQLDGDDDITDEQKDEMMQLTEDLQNTLNADNSSNMFGEHKDSIYTIRIHDKYVWSTDGADQLYVWDMNDSSVLQQFNDHTDTVVAIAMDSSNKYMATASMDATISIYEFKDGKYSFMHKLEGPGADIEWIEWHSSGPIIVAGSADNCTWMWNAVTTDLMQVFSGHNAPVTCGGFTFDGKVLCTASEDSTLFIWSPKNGKSIFHVKGVHENAIISMANHPQQRIVLTGSVDTTAKLFNVQTGKLLADFKGHEDSVEGVGFCNVLRIAATGSVDGKIKIWDLDTAQDRLTMSHDHAVTQIKWHPTEPLLYSSSLDRTVRIWDARSGENVRTFHGHHNAVLCFDISKDGKTIVSGGDDQTCLVFNFV